MAMAQDCSRGTIPLHAFETRRWIQLGRAGLSLRRNGNRPALHLDRHPGNRLVLVQVFESRTPDRALTADAERIDSADRPFHAPTGTTNAHTEGSVDSRAAQERAPARLAMVEAEGNRRLSRRLAVRGFTRLLVDRNGPTEQHRLADLSRVCIEGFAGLVNDAADVDLRSLCDLVSSHHGVTPFHR